MNTVSRRKALGLGRPEDTLIWHETGRQNDAQTNNTRVGSVLLTRLALGDRVLIALRLTKRRQRRRSKISPDNPKFGWILCVTVLNNSNNSSRCEQLNNVKS